MVVAYLRLDLAIVRALHYVPSVVLEVVFDFLLPVYAIDETD